ncbi:MAG: metal ABC transporter permease [Patescibacteria group bacterium]
MPQDFFNYLQIPFVQRAIFGGIIIAIFASILGGFAGIRRSYFFAESLAHSSLAGVALGLFINQNPIVVAVIYSLLVSLALPYLKKVAEVSYDNLLGIILPSSMALGVLLFSSLPGYQPQLFSYLFGNILSISGSEILFLLGLLLISMFFLKKYFSSLVLISVDKTYGKLVGLPISFLEFFYHMLMAVVVIMGARLVGIILLNSLFIIPQTIANSRAKSLQQSFLISSFISVFCVIFGIVISILLTTPPGITIALVAAALFAVNIGLSLVFPRNNRFF